MLRVQNRDMAAGRYFRHGKSYAVLIPAQMREQLGWTPNDCVLMCYEHGILWMAKPDKSLIISREKVSKIMDALFPTKDEKNVRA